MSVSGIREGARYQAVTDSHQKNVSGGFSKILKDTIPALNNPEVENPNQDTLIELGKISKETPTVSHILINHPEYSHKCWDIVFSSENRDKQFTKMREGTVVSIKPGSNELFWGGEHRVADNQESSEDPITAQGKEAPQASLADAVKPYIGTPYNQIDCYGLVVRGLENQGVKYNGHGGLREKLENLAARNGRPGNAYFTGEGLVEQAGLKVYSKSIQSISNPREKTDEIYSEISPYLREGMVLSFSTPTRGHTGVISRQGAEWTYINAGVIDHGISHGRVSKRVGEEVLKAEIKNWCVLAASRKEPLIVTAGHINGSKSDGSGRLKETI